MNLPAMYYSLDHFSRRGCLGHPPQKGSEYLYNGNPDPQDGGNIWAKDFLINSPDHMNVAWRLGKLTQDGFRIKL